MLTTIHIWTACLNDNSFKGLCNWKKIAGFFFVADNVCVISMSHLTWFQANNISPERNYDIIDITVNMRFTCEIHYYSQRMLSWIAKPDIKPRTLIIQPHSHYTTTLPLYNWVTAAYSNIDVLVQSLIFKRNAVDKIK